MRKIATLILILLALFLNIEACFAQARNVEGYYVWEVAGGNPRKHGGIKNEGIEGHRRWIQSEAGQNDLRRTGMPEKLVQFFVKMTQEDMNAYGREVTFPSGEKGKIYEMTALKGLKYRNMTFANGKVVPLVILGFDSDVARMELTDGLRRKWIIDTHKVCCNQGDYYVNIVTPIAPHEETPPTVTEVIRYYYETSYISLPQYQYAMEKSVSFNGIFGGIAKILASVFRRPDNNQTSFSFTGGNMKQRQDSTNINNTDVDSTNINQQGTVIDITTVNNNI